MAFLSRLEAPGHTQQAATAAPGSAPVDILIVRDFDVLEGLWQQLPGGGNCSIFQSFAVLTTWAEKLASSMGVQWLVAVMLHPRTRQPLLLLPLVLRRVDGLTMIEGADLGVADFYGPVVAPGFLPSPADMIVAWSLLKAALPAADVLRLSKMPARLGGARNPLLMLPNVNRTKLSNFKTDLDGDWERWMAANVPEKVREDMKARTRKLSKRGHLAFAAATNEAQADAYFAALIAQRQARFKELGRSDILDDPNYRAYYRKLLRPGDPTSPAEIEALSIDGEIIATGYGLVGNATFHMIFPSFKGERWRNYSPGLQLFLASMKRASERGLKHYDFTIGGEAFKRDLGAEEYPLYEKLAALSVRGLPIVYTDRLRRFIQRNPKFSHLAARLRGGGHGEGMRA